MRFLHFSFLIFLNKRRWCLKVFSSRLSIDSFLPSSLFIFLEGIHSQLKKNNYFWDCQQIQHPSEVKSFLLVQLFTCSHWQYLLIISVMWSQVTHFSKQLTMTMLIRKSINVALHKKFLMFLSLLWTFNNHVIHSENKTFSGSKRKEASKNSSSNKSFVM